MMTPVDSAGTCRRCVLAVVVSSICFIGSAGADLCPLLPPDTMQLTVPTRMINDKSLTLKAELFDVNGEIAWNQWDDFGSISAVRVSDQAPVPISIVIFDLVGGPPPADTIRFYNGIGCATITLDNGDAEAAGDIEITISVSGTVDGEAFSVANSAIVTVLDDPPLRQMSGTLSGAELTWGPDDGVIHLTAYTVVPSLETLTILPGTLIMVDAGAEANGTRIDVAGAVEAIGTQADPIFFFPTNGAPALQLMYSCDGPPYNPDAWRGIFHSGNDTSEYKFVFVTGAGNGPPEGHARPPVLRFVDNTSLDMADCVLGHNNGKSLYSASNGAFTVRRTLFSHCGHGAEWAGEGMYTLLVEDSRFHRLGRGPEACDYDGDCLNILSQSAEHTQSKIVQRCIFTDGGDDGIDTSRTSPIVRHCIFWGLRDKGISMEGDGVLPELYNLLFFDLFVACDGHFGASELPGTVYKMSYATSSPNGLFPLLRSVPGTMVDQCILYPQEFTTCGAVTINYSILGLGSTVSCGDGNLAADPLFVDTAARDYRLQPGSPGLDAGPNGERIGWLGFPRPFLFGDCNGDCQIDLDDFADFEACLSGPDVGLGAGCECFDFDESGTIDLIDFGGFQAAFMN